MQPDSSKQIRDTYIPGMMSVEDIENTVSLEDARQYVAAQFDFSKHPYFTWMKITDRESFSRSQIPFRYAVEGFSCALAATLAKIPELEQRQKLAENVAEEHGLLGDKLAHKYTITLFLKSLGLSDKDINVPCPAGVHAFNQSLRNYCLSNSAEAGAAMLGMIEYVFITVSGSIAKHVIDSQWTGQSSLYHYQVHQTLDIEHSQVLLQVCDGCWAIKHKRSEICQGLILGAYYFWDLYNELFQDKRNLASLVSCD